MKLVAHAIKDRKIMAVVATWCSTEPGAPRVLQRYDNEEHKGARARDDKVVAGHWRRIYHSVLGVLVTNAYLLTSPSTMNASSRR